MKHEIPIYFYGTIKDGKRFYYKPKDHQSILDSMEGTEFEEIIVPRRREVTLDQHAYYRASLRWVINETEVYGGWDEKILHAYFANKYLGYDVHHDLINPTTGKVTKTIVVRIVPSTADIGKKKMSVFIENVIQEIAEHGIEVPSSDSFDLRRYTTQRRYAKEGLD